MDNNIIKIDEEGLKNDLKGVIRKIMQVLFCKFMRKKRIFPSPSRSSKLCLPSIRRVVPSAATL